MSVATAFFLIAMPMAVGVAAHLLVAGSAALLAGGLTWAAISFAGRPTRPSRPQPEFVADDALPFHLHGEEYPEVPWRPIFASEIGSPDMQEGPPVLDLTHVVVDEEPAPIEPLSIAALMARLETAVERRAAQAKLAVQTPPSPFSAPNIGGDGTLRNVLDELQRMAVRQQAHFLTG